MILYEALFVYIKLRLALWKQCLGYHDQNLAYRQFDVEYSYKLWSKPNYLCDKMAFVCSKFKEMLILLYWSSSEPTPWRHTLWYRKMAGALAPKAVTKHPFFFKMVTLIMFVIYFLIKVEITLLYNVNLTDCFTSTLKPLLYKLTFTVRHFKGFLQ